MRIVHSTNVAMIIVGCCFLNFSASPAVAATDADYLASARQHKGMFEDAEAIEQYTKYLKIHPNDEMVRKERAEELLNEHRFDECISDFKILVKSKNPSMGRDAACHLGKVYQQRGNYKEAIATFRVARSLGESRLLSEIADCAIATDDWKLAIDTTSMMMKEEPIIGHDRRAKAYLAMHQPKDALIDCNYVVDTYKKKFARINKESRESLEIEKKLALALQERAKVYDALNQPKLAKQDRDLVKVSQKEIFDDTPFSVKDKH